MKFDDLMINLATKSVKLSITSKIFQNGGNLTDNISHIYRSIMYPPNEDEAMHACHHCYLHLKVV